MGRVSGGGWADPRCWNTVHTRAHRPFYRTTRRAGYDVPPGSQWQRAGVQELQTRGARLHGMKPGSAVIIGAGVMGASVAYHLAARGWRDVVMLDRSEAPGLGSTGAAT